MWVDPRRDDWRIFEGGTGSTLPMPCCEDDDDDNDDDENDVQTIHNEANDN